MSKLFNYKSREQNVLNKVLDEPYLSQLVESYIYEKVHEYFPNGTIKSIAILRSGKRNGDYIVNHPNGSVYLKEQYVDGVCHGIRQHYCPLGCIMDEATVVKGRKNGPYKEWFANGQLRFTGSYSNNNLSGRCLHYFEDGTVHKD